MPRSSYAERMGVLGRLIGKVRCPVCASVARHPRDRNREAEIREVTATLLEDVSGPPRDGDALLKGLGGHAWGEQRKRAYICSSCGVRFDSDAALIWDKRAKRLGDQEASARYREFRELLEQYTSCDR